MNKHQISRLLFICSDLVAGIFAWSIFYLFRKSTESGAVSIGTASHDPRFLQALLIIPIVWCIGFAVVGAYRFALYKTILGSLQEVVFVISVGAVLLLLFVLYDDAMTQPGSYVQSFFKLLVIHLTCFSVLRILMLLIIKSLINKGVWTLKVFRIGTLEGRILAPGQLSIGTSISVDNYLSLASNSDSDLIVLDEIDRNNINNKLSLLIGSYKGYAVYIHESLLSYLNHDFQGVPSLSSNYVKIFVDPLSSWQYALKRTGDITMSILALTLLSPLLVWIAIRVRESSPGPVVYRQERIGIHSVPFTIYKFRSMTTSAEVEGPLLASHDDERCTPFGAWMRRWRLDELPQFINVLQGDMSIVGPRPERKYFAEQLIKLAPRYPLLWRAKPGITSWGQIKYGYASTIDEMLQRFRYDLLYMDRMGPLLDLRILWYTVIVLIQGKGR